MFIVKFSDKTEFIFTENQIKYIPYFKTLLESDLKKDFQINHSSIGFDFLHTYATLDEIDITDPQDKYLFVLKQCDFFCYDKLKELVEKKYGFRTDVSEVKDNICKEIKCYLTYLGSIELHEINLPTPSTVITSVSTVHIEIIYEPLLYSTDSDINNIFVERYKQKMEEYYLKLFNDMFCTFNIKNIQYGNYKYNVPIKENKYISTNIGYCLSTIKSEYIIKVLDIKKSHFHNNNIAYYSTRDKNTIYQIYKTNIF